jgi:hypothetical protein
MELNDKDLGISKPVPYEKMSESARILRDTYAIKPGARIYQKEFGYYCLEAWIERGEVDEKTVMDPVKRKEIFGYDDDAQFFLPVIGGCEAPFDPYYPEMVLEDRGEHEVVQDKVGRRVLCFKGRRNGFMPEYLDHPVKDKKTWEENCKWRMDPGSKDRFKNLDIHMANAVKAAREGQIVTQYVVGGYMYLRSLIGPVELLYMFYDNPKLIHECMEAWLAVADRLTEEYQKHVTVDEILFDEDICYNKGSLISPEMIREFLMPYYQQYIQNVKRRQLDKERHLYIHVATDGYLDSVIDVYRDIGVDRMSPFEVASGCDVRVTGAQRPYMVMSGGIDKRVLAKSKDAIDRYLDELLPVMKKRGGYIPTCDHGVPAEVSFELYCHYRKRCLEYR